MSTEVSQAAAAERPPLDDVQLAQGVDFSG